MNKLLFFLIVFNLFISLASADMITPGYRGISIKNVINNIEDYPDYVFVSECTLGGKSDGSLKIINSIGEIEPYYKYCRVSVYAIKKIDFNESLFYGKEVHEFFNSPKAKKVIENIETYTEVPDYSLVMEIVRDYSIDINKATEKPNKIKVERSSLVYLYMAISFFALIVILYLLRRKNAK